MNMVIEIDFVEGDLIAELSVERELGRRSKKLFESSEAGVGGGLGEDEVFVYKKPADSVFIENRLEVFLIGAIEGSTYLLVVLFVVFVPDIEGTI